MQLDLSNILKSPRVTEKATLLASRDNGSVYTFEVPAAAGKKQIAEAVEHYYKVKPVKIGIVNLPAKRVMVRRRPGVQSGVKKAFVYLKKGDSIEFV